MVAESELPESARPALCAPRVCVAARRHNIAVMAPGAGILIA